MKQNNIAINYLRSFVTLLVLAHHSFIAYASFAPSGIRAFTSKPYIWQALPVVDVHRWQGFDLFILFNDTFFMSLMFFLSGLFVWGSITRKGATAYLRDRCLRLGLPLVFLALVLMPLAYYPSYLLRGGDGSVSAYASQWLSLDAWPIGPGWFIGVLLALDLVAVLLHRFASGWVESQGRVWFGARRPSWLFLAVLLGISLVAHLMMGIAFGPTRWFALGPFAIQASRALLYPIYFFAGLMVGVAGMDRSLLARDGQLVKNWTWWLGASLIAFMMLVLLLVRLKTSGSPPSHLLMTLAGIFFALSCGAISFFLLGFFMRFANRRVAMLDRLGTNGYGMYLVHYVIVTWTQFALLSIALPAQQKGVIVFGITLLASWITIAALRKISIVDRILGSGYRPEPLPLAPAQV